MAIADDEDDLPGHTREGGGARMSRGRSGKTTGSGRSGLLAPLAMPVFRRIWIASVLSNLGLLVNGVGAAWLMTRLSGRADDVALVQAALMLPSMCFAMVAGAVADTYDQRKVCLVALSLAIGSASVLTITSVAGLLTPMLLLSLCFLTGATNAMLSPAWQASVREQVPAAALPAAVALNSISYNVARSIGPAVGGVLVAAFGATAAFLANALLYLPMTAAILFWRRPPVRQTLPPERIGWAIVSGVRYIAHSPMRTVMVRCFLTGLAGAAILALMPLVARDLLHAGAGTFGLLLAAFGLGAVIGAATVSRVGGQGPGERTFVLSSVTMGVATVIIAMVGSPIGTVMLLVIGGVAWLQLTTGFNVIVQTQVPRWVAGRALAGYQASLAGGIAAGSWLWGEVAQAHGVATALVASGVALILLALVGPLLRLPEAGADHAVVNEAMSDPDVALPITGRSGPVIVEIEYRVTPGDADAFHKAILPIRRVRWRNGAYGWSIARDIARPDLWVERFRAPTWHDYLRQRTRLTTVERVLYARVETLLQQAPTVRRLLDRPAPGHPVTSARDDAFGGSGF